ncbi:hypothetical protein BJ508DRAFT_304953 [Ascobolus immersus RN42]|uniref:Uncharacterized protein n=1 Tax=Ascobolus immersus RN42 TaxID=1160509 RepID=A0A3N4ICL6_ASCIM|nr:hypothetical protein BJ508DRAFT_304953 [Ascobolus immersus RN42]
MSDIGIPVNMPENSSSRSEAESIDEGRAQRTMERFGFASTNPPVAEMNAALDLLTTTIDTTTRAVSPLAQGLGSEDWTFGAALTLFYVIARLPSVHLIVPGSGIEAREGTLDNSLRGCLTEVIAEFVDRIHLRCLPEDFTIYQDVGIDADYESLRAFAQQMRIMIRLSRQILEPVTLRQFSAEGATRFACSTVKLYWKRFYYLIALLLCLTAVSRFSIELVVHQPVMEGMLTASRFSAFSSSMNTG